MQDFSNLIYQNSLISTIKKATRVTTETATAINHILTNSFVDTDFKSAMFKTDIFDHFAVSPLVPLPSIAKSENETTFVYKRTFSSDSIEMFKQNLYEINCWEVETNQNPNETYKIFLEKIQSLYNHFFPEKKIKKDLKDFKKKKEKKT